MTSNQQRRWLPEVHPCPRCGRQTIFRLCDLCFAIDVSDAATGPLPPLAQAILRAQEFQQPSIGGPLDGDEFAGVLRAVRMAREVKPQYRFWSGMCLWCAREIREQSGEEVTHRPPLHLIQTCPRHRRGLLALMAWLREQKFGKDGAA